MGSPPDQGRKSHLPRKVGLQFKSVVSPEIEETPVTDVTEDRDKAGAELSATDEQNWRV
jgi:hypothetical protein